MILNPSREKLLLLEHWAIRYLDSGVFLQTETDRMSGCNYDSDESQDSEKTTHHSHSYVLPEMEVKPCLTVSSM